EPGPSHLPKGFVDRRGLEREMARFGAIGPVGCQRFPSFQPQSALTRGSPNSEVGHSWRLIEPEVGQVPKSGHSGIEQCAQDSWPYLLEFAPELRLVAAHLRLHVEELHDQCSIEKVGPRGAQVGNRIEHHGTGSVEDRFVMIAVEFPAAETAAGGQPASCVGEFLRQMAQVIEAYEPGIPCRRGQIANFTGYAAQCPGARVDKRADYSARGRLARSLLTLGDKNRAGHAGTQRRDQKGLDERPALVVDVEERPEFVQASAGLGCGQRAGTAGAMKSRRRTIYYPP